MTFYTFQLSRVEAQNIRSRVTDIDLLTFGILVNGHDKGHGSALVPMWPGTVLTGNLIEQAAAVNGHPHSRRQMTKDWVVGPVDVLDGDNVSLVYTATNTSDSQLPTADQRAIDEWTIKLLNIYYSILLGEFVSGLGLRAVADFIGANLTSAAVAFLADPVGTILGVEPQGPCNGTVFADAKEFTGAALKGLPSTPAQVTLSGQTLRTNSLELKHHYSDEATHDHRTCGDTAQTDVTVKIVRYEHFSLRMFAGLFWSEFGLAGGLRRRVPEGGNLRELIGARVS